MTRVHVVRSFRFLLAGLSLGCVGTQDGENIDELVTGPLHANLNSVWTAKPGATTPVIIPVCFENYGRSLGAAASTALFRTRVQDAVSSTWQRYARINFTGWGTCPVPAQPVVPGTKGAAGIHIFLDPPTNGCNANCPCPAGGPGKYCGGVGTPGGNTGGPMTGSVGAADGPQGYLDLDGYIATTADTRQAGMRLNSDTTNDSDVRMTAVHEFGHALGLWHEEQRTDTPPILPNCATNFGSQRNGTRYGAYDQSSIMSYCARPPFGRLSANDIMAIQRIYGRRPAGEFVSRKGLCLTAKSSDTNPYLWTCDEPGADQLWNYTVSGYSLFRDYATDKCLTATSANNGTAITSANCGGISTTQQWRFQNIEIRGSGGKCLHHTGTGNQLDMVPCSSEQVPSVNSTREKWSVMSNGAIHLTDVYAKCVTVSGTTDGSAIRLEDCGTPIGNNQKFTFNSDGTIRPLSVSKCMDVAGPTPAQHASGISGPGTVVQLYTCVSGATQLTQKWNFSGQLRLASDTVKCMDRPSSQDVLSTRPQVYDCWADPDNPFPSGRPDTSAHTSQQWDYYFSRG